ncbi:MAG: hypothetical protein KA715_11130 [Xanthomonadaceae bacterium]|nr:hypothetical protein [Xanthomonadaceae bacterium]
MTLFLAFSFLMQSLAWSAQVYLGVGEQRRMTLPFAVSQYSVGSDVIRVHVSDKKSGKPALLIKGVKKGAADVWLKGANGEELTHRFQVSPWMESGISPALTSTLSGLKEMEIIAHGDTTFIHGVVSDLSEWRKLGQIEKLGAGSKIQVHAELSPDIHSKCITELEKKKSVLGVSGLKIDSSVNPPRMLGAVSDTKNDFIRAELSKSCPLARLELETLGEKGSTLYFRVFLLEVKKSQYHHFGLASDVVSGGFQAKLSNLTSLIDLERTFTFLSQDGSLRVLSKPEISVRAPGEAELLAGGEIPIKITNRNNANVLWKNYGLGLKIKVNQATTEKIRLEISTEVSHLDYTNAIDNVPGIKTNRMKTQVDAVIGRPLFLSGLLQEDSRRDVKGLPGLKDIPVLGALFSSQEYMNAQSELVAILLPHGEPARAPIEKFGELDFPTGAIPPPQSWISTEDMRIMRASPDYPWNALE